MIFVTLGTHPAPMDRLVHAIDALIEDGVIQDDVIIQSAAFGDRPRRARAVGVEPYEQIIAWLDEAAVVITHGGPGSIMQAIAAGHRPIVVPRDPLAGEHVDDHQVTFAAWLADRRPIRVVRAMADLGPAIMETSGHRATRSSSPRPEFAIARLREILEAS